MTALEKLGGYIAESRRPSEALRKLVEIHLIDTVGAWIAGAGTVEGKNLLRFRAMTSKGQAGEALAPDLATRCALARLSEIDNIHLSSMTTPGAIIIPGALTLAAAAPGITGDDVIAAIIAGTEAMTRLGRAVDGPSILYRGIWPTYFAAPFGMAAVAARLLKLEAERIADALALALTLAAPAVGQHSRATTSRWFALGNAARNGLTAGLAAQHGFTSDHRLIEGQLLPGVFGIAADVSAFTDALGERIALSEVSFKPWCAARQTMAATQALRHHRGWRRAERDRGGHGRGAATAPQDDRSRHRHRRPRLLSHERAILHGDSGARARGSVRCPANIRQATADRSGVDGEDQSSSRRTLARRLSAQLACTRTRHRWRRAT
jgi:2-methylcitrate dehydratase PrpD